MKLKRIIAALLLVCMIVPLAACQSGNEAETAPPEANGTKQPDAQTAQPAENTPQTENTDAQTAEPTDAPAGDTEPPAGTKTLVVFFSRVGEQYRVGVIDKGNTAIVAEMIKEKTGADSFEIVAKDEARYPLTYSELLDVAKREQQQSARPEIKGELPDISQYDTIFIGAPVWWGDWPMIVYSFVESVDLSGKTLIPFSTHEGSGLSGFDRKLAAVCKNSNILEGLAVSGTDAQNNASSVSAKLDEWLKRLGF